VLLIAHQCFWRRVSRALSLSLAALIAVQLLLGLSSWMVKYGMPQWAAGLIGETGHFNRASDTISAAIVTAHGAIGSLIVALSVVLAVQVARRVQFRSAPQRPIARTIAGAAV
jgi:hypothetical protein